MRSKRRKFIHTNYNLTEDNEEEILDNLDIETELDEIANKLGYSFMPNGNGVSGSISVSDYLTVSLRYYNNEISKITVDCKINNNGKIDCTRNTTTADNLSVDLQTCILIIKDIKQKLM